MRHSNHPCQRFPIVIAPFQLLNECLGLTERQDPARLVLPQDVGRRTIRSSQDRQTCSLCLSEHNGVTVFDGWKQKKIRFTVNGMKRRLRLPGKELNIRSSFEGFG